MEILQEDKPKKCKKCDQEILKSDSDGLFSDRSDFSGLCEFCVAEERKRRHEISRKAYAKGKK